MSNTKRIILYIIALLVIAYLMPVEKNWTPSYSEKHNWPYGADVTRDIWTDLFPNVDIVEAELPIWNTTRDLNYDEPMLYILFDGYLRFDSLNRSSLLDFVNAGNSAFVSTFELDDKLMTTLGIDSEYYYGDVTNLLEGDEIKKCATTFFEGDNSEHSIKVKSYDEYYITVDSLESDMIAIAHGSEEDHVTFARVRHGDGYFYLHNHPLLLTNYYALQDDGKAYIEKLTSYLPSQKIIWDTSHKAINAMQKKSPLHVVLNAAALRWAYWLVVLGVVLLFLFRTKRRQRIIPIVEPPKNDSTDFAQTMGSLYFNTATNKTLADKKISVLKEYLSREYYMRDIQFGGEEEDIIFTKTDLNKEEIARIFKVINQVQSSGAVSNGQLKVLNKGINRIMGKN